MKRPKLWRGKTIRQSAHRSAVFIGIATALISIIAASVMAKVMADQNNRDYKITQTQRATSVQSYVNDLFFSYKRLLVSSASSNEMRGGFNREDWQTYYEKLLISKDFPAVLGLGYVTHLKPEEVSDFENKIRAEGYPDFTVRPTTLRQEYTAITYLEPFNEVNQRAFGYDMFSEPKRNAAMSYARDHNTAVMSAPVALVQDSGSGEVDSASEPAYGVLIYYPVYYTRTAPDSVQDRRANIKGYVYIVVRPKDVISDYLNRSPDIALGSDVRLIDNTDGRRAIMYSVDNSSAPDNRQIKTTKDIKILNRKWTIEVAGRSSLISRFVGPSVVIILGSFLGTLLGFISYYGLRRRFERIEKSYDREVQKTKDELLALASHQLRTPASGVKQYLGMLTQGFVGELTTQQLEIAQKAYDANERQLEIINELLYVSKADAGQLMIEPTDTDLTAMTKRVVEQFEHRAKSKNISLSFQNVTPRNVWLDSRYGSMIVENLISNAIKYSKPDTKVIIRLKDVKDNVALSVSDQGVGIAEEDIPNIFAKFSRIPNPLSVSEGGSGLGLFLAMQLVKAHGGDIEVKSIVGKGSTFTMTLPKKSSIEQREVSLRAEKQQKGKQV